MAGQQWALNSAGGFLANPRLSRQVRTAATLNMKFRQFVRPEPGYGKGKGDRILIDRITQVQTKGGKLSENVRIPETSVVISQQSVIVFEYGNAIPYTGKLEALAEFSAENITTKALRDDQMEVLDSDAAGQFQAAKVKYTATGSASAPTNSISTTGSAGATATRDVMGFDIKEMVNSLVSTFKAPPYDGEFFVAICPREVYTALTNDTDVKNDFRYGDPERYFVGEIGTYQRVRFVEENNVLATTVGTTSFRAEFVVFGDDPVAEGLALPAEIRAKIPDDYGRSKGLAWYGLLGFIIVWDTATARQAKIIHYTSN
jgi:N4-gp56 family major capsid protein